MCKICLTAKYETHAEKCSERRRSFYVAGFDYDFIGARIFIAHREPRRYDYLYDFE